MKSGEFWRLGHVSDERLRSGICDLLAGGARIEALLIAHLAEVESRRLYLVDGYSAMFHYCQKQLRMSEGEAFLRIAAARTARKFPVVFEMVARHEIHLTGVCLLRDHLTADNYTELLGEAAGKSKMEVLELLARRFPGESAETRVRRLREPKLALPQTTATPVVPSEETSVPSAAREAALPPSRLAAPSNRLESPKQVLLPVAEQRYRLQLDMSKQLKEKLDLARALSSHANPAGHLALILEQAVDLWLAKVQQRRFGKTRRPRKARPAKPRAATDQAARPPASGRAHRPHIANDTRREVVERDGMRCTYVSPDGVRCDSQAFVQFHHEHAAARGGAHDSGNLRLLCFGHNQLRAEQDFGTEHMARFCKAT